jgi:hypothetical protein
VRAEAVLVVAVALGCAPARVLTRPEGDGGWTATRRTEELTTRARAARIALDGAETPAADDLSAPITLDDVVGLATAGSRRIAEASFRASRARDVRPGTPTRSA